MANLTLARMRFPTLVTGSGANSGMANLSTPAPKEVAVVTSGTTFNFDFGAAFAFDTFFLGFLSPSVTSTTVGINTQTDMAGTGLALQGSASVAASTAARRHAFLKLAAPVTSRYWRCGINYTSPMTIGIVGFGLSVQPTFGHEWGSGRQPVDTASVTSLRGGGFAVEKGAIKGAWQFTLGDLTDADLSSLWDMALDIGISNPVLASEDPAAAQPDLNKGLHYGLLDRPDVYERQLPGISRWSWRVEEWV